MFSTVYSGRVTLTCETRPFKAVKRAPSHTAVRGGLPRRVVFRQGRVGGVYVMSARG